jgi:hypothetical protein
MEIQTVADGPVTIQIDSPAKQPKSYKQIRMEEKKKKQEVENA